MGVFYVKTECPICNKPVEKGVLVARVSVKDVITYTGLRHGDPQGRPMFHSKKRTLYHEACLPDLFGFPPPKARK